MHLEPKPRMSDFVYGAIWFGNMSLLFGAKTYVYLITILPQISTVAFFSV